MAVYAADIVVGAGAEFDRGHIPEPKHLAVGQRLEDHVLVIDLVFVAAAVLEHILEGVCRLSTQSAGGGLDVLLVEHGGNVGRNQPVLEHLARIEPDAHRVFIAEDVDLAHAGDTR